MRLNPAAGAGVGVRLAAFGIGIGLPAAWLFGRVLAALVEGIDALDPLAYGVVIVGLTATVVLAALGPARRAARVDPLVALRAE